MSITSNSVAKTSWSYDTLFLCSSGDAVDGAHVKTVIQMSLDQIKDYSIPARHLLEGKIGDWDVVVQLRRNTEWDGSSLLHPTNVCMSSN